jgi:hypothetical protein
VIVDQAEKGRPQQEILRSSEFVRLQARLESLPVIEQAKGILMAQHDWGPDEAFAPVRTAVPIIAALGRSLPERKVQVRSVSLVNQRGSGRS